MAPKRPHAEVSADETAASSEQAAASEPDPPPDAAQLTAAQFWYYEGHEAVLQGPFRSQDMRSWFESGYLAPTLQVAPSWYGEVPTTFWAITTLWAVESVRDQAFVTSEQPPAAAATTSQPEYIEANTFDGRMGGYTFKTDVYGTGYYLDHPRPIEITAEDIEAKKAARKAAAMAFRTHIAAVGADFREHKG